MEVNGCVGCRAVWGVGLCGGVGVCGGVGCVGCRAVWRCRGV